MLPTGSQQATAVTIRYYFPFTTHDSHFACALRTQHSPSTTTLQLRLTSPLHDGKRTFSGRWTPLSIYLEQCQSAQSVYPTTSSRNRCSMPRSGSCESNRPPRSTAGGETSRHQTWARCWKKSGCLAVAIDIQRDVDISTTIPAQPAGCCPNQLYRITTDSRSIQKNNLRTAAQPTHRCSIFFNGPWGGISRISTP
jgi:hypothetical protein